MNPNIWAHRIYSAGGEGGGEWGMRGGGCAGGSQQHRFQHAPQVHSISQQTQCGTAGELISPYQECSFSLRYKVGEEFYPGTLSYFSRSEVSPRDVIHGKVFL